MRPVRTLSFAILLAALAVVPPGCSDDAPQTGIDLPGGDTGGDTALPDAPRDPGPGCVDTCPEDGAKECVEGGTRTCADLDDDGCVEWTLPTACAQGTVCKWGECVSACPDQPCTAVGAKSCDTGNQVLTCGDYDANGCLEWGNPVTCGEGLVCAKGFCATSCASECTVIGSKKCQANAVVTCGDYNVDGCLEWGDATDCGAQVCSNGHCAMQCQDECTSVGSRQCELDGYVLCDDYDDDGCLEWGTVLYCGEDQVCSGGFCTDECTSDCTVQGARKCQMNAVVICGDYNEDGCLEWGSPVPCDQGLVCANGNCASQCANECTVALARQCDEAGRVVVCNDYNQDGCLEWGSPTPCDTGLVCSGGNCGLACANTCEIANERTCVAGTTTRYQVCGDYNEDGCLEWGTAQDCDGGLVCSGGNCAMSCDNECVIQDERKCLPGNAWTQCRDYNEDGCLEWGTPVYCEAYEACDGGACEPKAPPARILIDEIMIDTTSSPDKDAFVELWGPAGTDLTGWRLVGVNGANNAEYQVIALAGALGGDGRFVVAHPESQAAIHDAGDQFTADVDYQNGPDSIQLRYGATVVDAIGYGTFGAGDFFAGEGSPVPKPLANHSLARDLAHTDTDDNAADFTELATPTPGAPNQDVNEPPVAALACPGTGSLGQAVTFDASGSDDPDGALVSFAFDFGDGSPVVTGAAASVAHAFAQAGTFTVTVTITDDRGATDQASCQTSIGDDNAPTVDFIKPADQTQVTQGANVAVLVNPTAAPGRSIARVELLADGVATGLSDDAAPYEFTFAVPGDQPNNTTLVLQAKAVDNAGSVGFGSVGLRVRNDVPVASFTAVVSGDKQITADASSSRDTETATDDLVVRWDFTSDGTWDTDWSTGKVVQHTYPADGEYAIKLEVRDGIGQTATASRDIALSSIQYVGGTVTTTTWTGTIVITGDVTVPSGETLTIAAGTSVQFAYIDQNADGVGDYDITINGTLRVDGTAAQPVLLTVYGTDHRHAKAWNRLVINGTGSEIRHAILEYADIAIESKKDLAVEDTEIRFCTEGFRSSGASASTALDRVTVRDNAADGLVLTAGVVFADDCLLAANGARGAYVNGGTLNLSNSEVSGNGASGIEYLRSGGGTITRNVIGGNAHEGIRIWTDSTTDPTPVVNYNNIVGNATVGALAVDSPNLTVATDSTYSGTKFSTAWTNPSNATLLRIHMAYSESDSSSNYVSGAARKDSSSGVEIAVAGTASSRWYDVASYGAKGVVAAVTDNYSGLYSGTTTIAKAVYLKPGLAREAAVVTHSGTIDMRHNYFGVFPNVLDAVTLGSTTAADLHGFVGAAFDATWSKGIYFGGETISAETTWLGTVYITGDLTFSGTTLTVQPGTQVLFAPVDQDGNGVGDYDLNVSGCAFTVAGTQAAPVRFSSVGGVAKGFQEVKVAGGTATSDIRWAVFEKGYVGLHLESGTHAVADCTFQDDFQQGLWLKSNSGTQATTVTGGTVRNNNRGILVESFRNLTLDRVTIEDNASDGLAVSSSTTALALTNATVRRNAGNGVLLTNATVDIGHCNIQYNAMAGVRYQGTSAGSLTYSNVKFNDEEGILLASASGNPAPVINHNNLYGNALVTGTDLADPAQTAATDSAFSGTRWSAGWSTPAGQRIRWIRAAYSESDSSSNYVAGMAAVGSTGGTQVFNASSATSARFVDLAAYGATKVYAGVVDNYSGLYSGTTTIDVALYAVSNVPTTVRATELVAATDGGTVDCKSNFWGTFPDVQPRFTLGRTNAIDFQNFVGTEVAGAGPLP